MTWEVDLMFIPLTRTNKLAVLKDGGACLMRSKLHVASYLTCGSLSFQSDIKEHQNT